jgi:hypothetical protein
MYLHRRDEALYADIFAMPAFFLSFDPPLRG